MCVCTFFVSISILFEQFYCMKERVDKKQMETNSVINKVFVIFYLCDCPYQALKTVYSSKVVQSSVDQGDNL